MADDATYDIVVIGGGPGGYTAAIRAAQLGFTTACIDDGVRADGKPALGGTCTNVGCIPSKALLQSSEHFEHATHGFADHGIVVKDVSIDTPKMLARKDKVVGQNNDGIAYLFKKNKVASFNGKGAFTGHGADGYMIAVTGTHAATLIARHVIVATGSSRRALPGIAFDNRLILDNSGALAMPAVPKRLGVIGAGVVGLELGSVWRRLGADVTILEALPNLLAAADEAIAKEAQKQFARQGLAINLSAKVTSVKSGKDSVTVDWVDAAGASQNSVFDRLIVSVGRVPNTDGLGSDSVGLKRDARGFIEVDGDCATALPNVYAIGDVVRGPMLAHKAEEEAVAVAERIAGQKPHVDFNTVPWVIYTAPEIAWVGETEQQLKARGVAYKVGVFPFTANGRARAMGETRGFVKLIADAQSDRVLGMHAIGPLVSELIAEGVMAMEFGAASEDIARICHAHPTLSEATREAALAVLGRTLNL
ncbi:MAG: dihydrolipoyl dehydrogenase [Casimicrobiaceae bacterium]